MKRIDAIKSLYGHPAEETVNVSGDVISGWHLEGKDGEILTLAGMADNDIERIYDTSSPAPDKPLFLKFKEKWLQLERVDSMAIKPVVQGKEVSREDAICLDISAEINSICILMPLLAEIKTSPSVYEEIKESLKCIQKSIFELPEEIKS